MDSDGFFQFCEWFIEQMAALRARQRNILLTLDGYGAHKTFKSLNLLRNNDIVVIALPAHSSHRTQVLDFCIFSPFKTNLRNALNERILAPTGSVRNDIYTLCELIHNAYKESVTYPNIINGFKACGVWCAVRRRAIPEVIKITDISNIESYGTRQDAFESFLSLCESYKATRNLLRSDGPVLQNGTLNTKGGLMLTSDEVLRQLAEREAAREAAVQVRIEREATAEKRRSERERKAQERVSAKDKMERARIAHEKWMSERGGREMQRKITRAGRRATARHRALRLSR